MLTTKLSPILHRIRPAIIYTVLTALSASIFTDLFIRKLGVFLGALGEETFARIFAQLETAHIAPGTALATITALCFSVIIIKYSHPAIKITAGTVGVLLSVCLCVLTANVNGIMLEHVIPSLISLFSGGALNNL